MLVTAGSADGSGGGTSSTRVRKYKKTASPTSRTSNKTPAIAEDRSLKKDSILFIPKTSPGLWENPSQKRRTIFYKKKNHQKTKTTKKRKGKKNKKPPKRGGLRN